LHPATGERVSWSDFAQPHRSGRRHSSIWRYDGFGPFFFEGGQYREALLAAITGAAQPD
jgi:hypothetical protein